MVDTPDVSSSRNHNKLGCPYIFCHLFIWIILPPHSNFVALKSIYSEKGKNFHLYFDATKYLMSVKKGKVGQIYAAFSEYLNFKGD